MISRLRGVLEIKKPPFILIDVGGVGYELQAPLSSFYHLPDCGSVVTLLTHLYIREEAHTLYGFLEERERSLFRTLIKVNGVGPKLALTILSGMEPGHFLLCIEHRDASPLIRLPGVGKKTAERLLVEMAGKLQMTSSEEQPFCARDWEKTIHSSPTSHIQDAVSALVALGYKSQEAARAIGAVQEEGLVSHELIRRALQGLAKA